MAIVCPKDRPDDASACLPVVLLTGGGTAGHITPNLALIKRFQSNLSVRLAYAGSPSGMERALIVSTGVPYYPICAGKLRRQRSWRNLLAPWQVLWGIVQSIWMCLRVKPDVVFSKGGFVSFPVVVAAWMCRIPVIVHESDLTPGLANRMSLPFAHLICVSFPQTVQRLKTCKPVLVTGLPVRESLNQGTAERGRQWLGFDIAQPVLLVWGGSLGADAINQRVWRLLGVLLRHFQIVHVCGRGKINSDFQQGAGYRSFEYLDEALPDVLACADLVLSRAGATAIYELLLLQKPHILLPLSTRASRGDQIQNARYLAGQGFSVVIEPQALCDEVLLSTLEDCRLKLPALKAKLATCDWPNGVETIYRQLLRFCKLRK